MDVMEKRGLWSEVLQLWREDRASQWRRPPSWWNLLILWPLPAILLWSVHNSRMDFEVADRQQSTVATINSHDPANHDRYGYVFLVNKRQYTGWAYPSDKIDYSIGEQIAIHYDPSNPTRNFVESFREAGERDLFFVPFCLLIAAALPLFIFLRRRGLSRRR
jgi:hypothetical protein